MFSEGPKLLTPLELHELAPQRGRSIARRTQGMDGGGVINTRDHVVHWYARKRQLARAEAGRDEPDTASKWKGGPIGGIKPTNRLV